MAVRAEGIEASNAHLDETKVHNRQQRNIDSSEAHIFEICMEAHTVIAVQEAIIGAPDSCRPLHVGPQHRMEQGRVKDGSYAEESGVDASSPAVGIGESPPLRRNDAASQVCSKLDRADLEKIVIDSAGPAERRDIIIDGTRISRFRRRLETAKPLSGKGPIDA